MWHVGELFGSSGSMAAVLEAAAAELAVGVVVLLAVELLASAVPLTGAESEAPVPLASCETVEAAEGASVFEAEAEAEAVASESRAEAERR